MVVAPGSIKTVAGIASCFSDNLLLRSAIDHTANRVMNLLDIEPEHELFARRTGNPPHAGPPTTPMTVGSAEPGWTRQTPKENRCRKP